MGFTLNLQSDWLVGSSGRVESDGSRMNTADADHLHADKVLRFTYIDFLEEALDGAACR